jgi:hypothetical protein
MSLLRRLLARVPVLEKFVRGLYVARLRSRFGNSENYWIDRYAKGGLSGAGSYDELAVYKASFLNAFVSSRQVSSIIEHGCGDGNQLGLAEYPSYLGLDISDEALRLCNERFGQDTTKRFARTEEYDGSRFDLSLSLDVVYHLVEDSVFDPYMHRLFNSATDSVIIYSSNRDEQDEPQVPHVRHRKFSRWIEQNAPTWQLTHHEPNPHPVDPLGSKGSFADFFVYERGAEEDKTSA